MRAEPKLWAERTPTRGIAAASLSVMACALLAAACGETAPEATSTKKADDVIAACEAPSLALPDGSCIRPGIPPDGCSEGFEHDGEYGCDPILPAEACGPGMMAVPGETACRPVMPCGEGRWGDLPVDATTEYVDGSYAGGGSDGSSDKPWILVQDAYDAAPAGALVAIAAGRYTENLKFELKAIRLWGVCPEKVSIDGKGTAAAIDLGTGTDGSEIGGVAVTGSARGIVVIGTTEIALDRVWIHQTGAAALWLEPGPAPTSVRVHSTLMEGAQVYGIVVYGSELSLDASVVRSTSARPTDKMFGGGLRAELPCENANCDDSLRPKVALTHCVIEDNHTDGVSVFGTDFSLNASVVRNTRPQPATKSGGSGVVVQLACDVSGRCSPAQPSRATIVGSSITGNHSVGIFVAGSEADIVTTVVRDTLPQPLTLAQGAGLVIQTSCPGTICDPEAPSTGTIRKSLVEGNHTSAIMVIASTATVEHTVARNTLPEMATLGHGTGIQAELMCDYLNRCDADYGSHLTVLGSLVEDNYDAGIIALYSEAHLSSTVVRRTAARQDNGTMGDGVVLGDLRTERVSTVDTLRIEESARAGLTNFGTFASIARTSISCGAFDLVGQDLGTASHRFHNEGQNVCGCPKPNSPCKAVGAGLKPPERLR